MSARKAGLGSGRLSHYDQSSPAYALLQKPIQAMARFPVDRQGEVDWMQALREGIIQPRAALGGAGQMEVLDLDIVMTNTREMPYVRFPHRAHTEWLACSNCHDAIFQRKKGAHRTNMDAIFRGQYCGVCHDRIAFSVYICERCHSIPIEATGAPSP